MTTSQDNKSSIQDYLKCLGLNIDKYLLLNWVKITSNNKYASHDFQKVNHEEQKS